MENQEAYNSTNKKQLLKNCLFCNKEFSYKKYRESSAYFCSRTCRFEHKALYYKNKLIRKDDLLLCYECEEYLPFQNFYLRGDKSAASSREGRSQKCIKCINILTETWRNKRFNDLDVVLSLLVIRAKSSLKKRNITKEFNINSEFLKKLYNEQEGKCAISNIDMQYPLKGKRNNYVISLDRIDSEKGYIEGNVQLVCWAVNQMKNNLTKEDLIFWCKAITKNNSNTI
jgi:hypothetical protein